MRKNSESVTANTHALFFSFLFYSQRFHVTMYTSSGILSIFWYPPALDKCFNLYGMHACMSSRCRGIDCERNLAGIETVLGGN